MPGRLEVGRERGKRRGLAEMGEERGEEGKGREGLPTATVTAIQTKTQSRVRQKVMREFYLQI